jgi:hypothetical protein
VRRDQFLECRVGSLRHAWFDHDGSGFRAPPFGVANHYQCVRCGTVRRDIVDRVRGELLQRRYYHPQGYAQARDERPSTEEVRVAEVRRQRAHLRAASGVTKAKRRAG